MDRNGDPTLSSDLKNGTEAYRFHQGIHGPQGRDAAPSVSAKAGESAGVVGEVQVEDLGGVMPVVFLLEMRKDAQAEGPDGRAVQRGKG